MWSQNRSSIPRSTVVITDDVYMTADFIINLYRSGSCADLSGLEVDTSSFIAIPFEPRSVSNLASGSIEVRDDQPSE